MKSWKSAAIFILNRLLPARLKNSILHLSFHLAYSEFQRFSYTYLFAPNMEFGLARLATHGFVPQTIIDVGAFHGDWSRLARRIWPHSSLIMIEPNLKNQIQLEQVSQELRAKYFDELLGSQDGEIVQFNVMESGSSIMEERSNVPRTTERRAIMRLDAVIKTLEAPALLKIDAQGYELKILEGASKIFSSFEAILLEVAVIEINVGAPLLHDVVAFMKQRGFVSYDILEIHRRPLDQALNQVDILFLREDSRLLKDKRLDTPSRAV